MVLLVQVLPMWFVAISGWVRWGTTSFVIAPAVPAVLEKCSHVLNADDCQEVSEGDDKCNCHQQNHHIADGNSADRFRGATWIMWE